MPVIFQVHKSLEKNWDGCHETLKIYIIFNPGCKAYWYLSKGPWSWQQKCKLYATDDCKPTAIGTSGGAFYVFRTCAGKILCSLLIHIPKFN